jgi:hypothetical protein
LKQPPPHTSKKLGKTATAGHADDYIGENDSMGIDVVERQNEGCGHPILMVLTE